MNALVSFITDRAATTRRDLTALSIIFGLAFFQFLGHFPLIEPDEGRYSEIPREMLERGDFITPLLNYVNYFEKPPLHYWLNALSFSLFGQNEFAARFPAACCGFLTVLFTYWLGARLFERRVGLWAALVLGASGGFLVQARINITDMTLTCCLTLSLGCFILATGETGRQKSVYFYLFYLFAALATLSKGLIGVLFPGAIIFLFVLLRKRWGVLKEMRIPTGSLLFLLVAAPWFILVSLRNPEFARFFFIHEHFERFLTKTHQRYQPLWFYLPILLGTMFPWSLFIPEALRRVWRERRSSRGDALVYLAVWATFIFIFFSKSNSKLVPYILPIFPPLALLIAWRFHTAMEEGIGALRGPGLVLAGLLVVVGIGAPLYPLLAQDNVLGLSGGIIMGSILLLEGVAGWLATRRGSTAGLLLALGLGSLWFAVLGPYFVYGEIAGKRTCKPLALMVREQAPPDALVASFGYDQTLPFYARRRVIVVGGRDELEFGSKQGDQSAWFIDRSDFKRLWEGDRPVFAVLRRGDFQLFVARATTPVRVVGTTPNRFLITNR